MKKILLLILLSSTVTFGQIDSVAKAKGWIKVQPKVFNTLDADTVRYFQYDDFIILDETNKRLKFTVRFYNSSGIYLGERFLNVNASTFFNYNWATYLVTKKSFVINKFNLTEVVY